jgi:hypothetical protein
MSEPSQCALAVRVVAMTPPVDWVLGSILARRRWSR